MAGRRVGGGQDVGGRALRRPWGLAIGMLAAMMVSAWFTLWMITSGPLAGDRTFFGDRIEQMRVADLAEDSSPGSGLGAGLGEGLGGAGAGVPGEVDEVELSLSLHVHDHDHGYGLPGGERDPATMSEIEQVSAAIAYLEEVMSVGAVTGSLDDGLFAASVRFGGSGRAIAQVAEHRQLDVWLGLVQEAGGWSRLDVVRDVENYLYQVELPHVMVVADGHVAGDSGAVIRVQAQVLMDGASVVEADLYSIQIFHPHQGQSVENEPAAPADSEVQEQDGGGL